MKNPNEFPSYNEPLSTNYESGNYPPEAFGLGGDSNEPEPTTPPQVVKWYKVYAGVMLVLNFFTMLLGFWLLRNTDMLMANAPGASLTEIKLRAVVVTLSGILMFVAFVVALVLPKSPGVWIFHAVLIAIGLSNCCLWPATIPLMIAWLKPETQRWFGRKDGGGLPPRDPNVPPPPIPSV